MDEPQENEDPERVHYPEEQRQANLAKLRELLGGPPPADMIEFAQRCEDELAARRFHAA
ncbi:MAG TPA: hypothetical protein VFV66_27855 [Nonomuraea sp.]|nr:hypothetical protein [Nonomuraea sp.]